jgi:hypothetical protein
MKKVRYIAGLAGLAPAAAGVMAGTAAHAAPAGGSPGRDASAVAKTAKTVSLYHLRAPDLRPARVYSCFDFESGYYGWCNAPVTGRNASHPARFYLASAPFDYSVYNGDRMKITCYYTGTSHYGDIYYDHIVREDSLSGVEGPDYYVGHMYDYFINFSNQTPKAVGLHHC